MIYPMLVFKNENGDIEGVRLDTISRIYGIYDMDFDAEGGALRGFIELSSGDYIPTGEYTAYLLREYEELREKTR